ncbi:glycosyltransferase family 4 protein, partial [Streptomyces lonarensis]|uniref:glycosyltransferase family 4 protein n=1 Tax=Streptomyces lonarensis TaxID=700599 RepID=UPI0030C6D80F
MTAGDRADEPLNIAFLTYKGNPFCGGQGVYVRHLSREIARLGHRVEVVGAQPYPVLDDQPGVTLTELPSLDLYREPDPFRTPRLGEYRDWVDALEVATMRTGGFPEPLTFSLRARRHLAARAGEFDVVHDNQTLGYGLLGLDRLGLPLVTTVHHPVTVDRQLEIDAAGTLRGRLSKRRWYAFTRMQRRVAGRLPSVLTVSGSSRRQIIDDLGVRPHRVHVVPIGADSRIFRPDPAVAEVPGRIVTTSSADVPLKGLVHLVDALAEVRRDHPDAHLVVVGHRPTEGPVAEALAAHGIGHAVEFVKGVSDEELADLVRSAQVACVPSLYEGFSLPAAEAMATGTPLVATTGGAIPEVAGPDGETCLAVEPGDAAALAAALGRMLGDPELRARIGAAGRARVLSRFTWEQAARGTVERYRAARADHRRAAQRGPAATGGEPATVGAPGASGPARPVGPVPVVSATGRLTPAVTVRSGTPDGAAAAAPAERGHGTDTPAAPAPAPAALRR